MLVLGGTILKEERRVGERWKVNVFEIKCLKIMASVIRRDGNKSQLMRRRTSMKTEIA